MILATAHHGYGNRTELSWDVGLFLDCDMAGFAAPDDVFDAQNIDLDDEARAHTSPEAYRAKRVPWLQQVQRNGVFMTPLFRAWGEAVARERNPARWSGTTRDWTPIGAVTLNPERDSVVADHSRTELMQPLAA